MINKKTKKLWENKKGLLLRDTVILVLTMCFILTTVAFIITDINQKYNVEFSNESFIYNNTRYKDINTTSIKLHSDVQEATESVWSFAMMVPAIVFRFIKLSALSVSFGFDTIQTFFDEIGIPSFVFPMLLIIIVVSLIWMIISWVYKYRG